MLTWFAKCEWTLFLPSHSECFLISDTRRVDVAKRSQVQDVRQQQCIWLISKTALISLPEAGAGRFPVSLGQWEMLLVFMRRLVWLEYPPFALEFHFPKNEWKGEIWKGDRSKREGESVLVKLHFYSTCLSALPRQQLVNVTQLTRLWYKLINDTQLARRGEKKREEKRKVNTW